MGQLISHLLQMTMKQFENTLGMFRSSCMPKYPKLDVGKMG